MLIKKTEALFMPKDSQPDNKKARVQKANGQTPLTREHKNEARTAKKQSAPRGVGGES